MSAPARWAGLVGALVVGGVVLVVGPPDPPGQPAAAERTGPDPADLCADHRALEEAHQGFAATPGDASLATLRERATTFRETAAALPLAPEVNAGAAYLAGMFLALPDGATVDDITAAGARTSATEAADVQALDDYLTPLCAQTGAGA